MMDKKLLKRNAAILIAALIAALVIYRVAAIVKEGDRQVSNIVRIHAESGVPVRTALVSESIQDLKFPLSLKNGRAFVPLDVKIRLKKGMSVGDQKITSISNNIDFDTGMYEVRVSGNLVGEFNATEPASGIFIPREAASDGIAWVAEDGEARPRKIRIAAMDAESILVAGGLLDGDMLIVSSSHLLYDGLKVKQ
ncbi:MAG: hypothetical protein LBG89_01640 [Rickettsiales bacterium]|jgi:hypothetical protein|nr:hypothetical protein [Rickettsiales bacterium]